MLNEQKYKRWAWGALIGLAAIIVVAGIIMAMSVKTPKPSENISKANTDVVSGEKNEKATEESKTNDSTKKDDKKTETKSETTKDSSKNSTSEKQSNSGSVNTQTPAATTPTTSNDIPKTGPEEFIIPVFGVAIVAYLFAYNAALFKKNA
jgi:cytoskeletal protein RodZ